MEPLYLHHLSLKFFGREFGPVFCEDAQEKELGVWFVITTNGIHTDFLMSQKTFKEMSKYVK